MISIFEENDKIVWVPVAAGKNDIPPRAFLPFNGTEGIYTFGYKASPSRANYLNALKEIQKAYIKNESQIFRVQGGKKEERQKKAKWRHGNEASASLLGPTLGWVAILLTEIEKVTDAEVGKALLDSGKEFAVLASAPIKPVLCHSLEQLDLESEKLKSIISDKQPVGQTRPKKFLSSVEQYTRDAAVVAYVLNVAAGICECCNKPAPFIKSNGESYLEVHHVKPLAMGGSDTIENTVAVCPNCHRELHYGLRSKELVGKIYSRLDRLVCE